MTLKQWLFEGGTDSAALTTANTGASIIFTSGGGAAQFDSASAAHGALGAEFTSGSNAAGCFGQFDADTPDKTFSASVTVTLPPAAPSVVRTFAKLWTAADNRALTFGYNTSGHLIVTDRGNTTLADWGGAQGGSITPGEQYRLNVWGVADTATTGTLNAALYDDADAPVGTAISISNANLDTFNITGWRIGALDDATGAYTIGVDDIQIDDGRTTELPSVSATTAPVADAGPDQTAITPGGTVTLDGTGSYDPNSDPITYAWTQTSGTTVTLSDTTAAQPTFTAPSLVDGDSLTFSLTVSDGVETSDPDTVNVSINGTGVVRQILFDTGPQGASLTTVNTGAALVFAGGGGSAVFDSTKRAHGPYGASFTAGSDGAGCFAKFDAPNPSHTFSVSVVLTLPLSVPSSPINLVQVEEATGAALTRLSLMADGRLVVSVVGGVWVATWAADAHTLGERYRFSFWGEVDTASTGTLHVRMYDTDDTTELQSYDGSEVNLGTSQVGKATVGALGTGVAVTGTTVGVDDLQLGTGATELDPVSGELVNNPPVAYAGPDQPLVEPMTLVTLDGTGSYDPDGAPVSYDWTQTSGPTVNLSDRTAAKPTFTAPAETVSYTRTFQLTVSDGDVSSPPDTVSVTIPAHPHWTVVDDAGTLTAGSPIVKTLV